MPKPFNAPSPASHRKNSLPLRSGRRASTKRLVIFGTGVSLIASPGLSLPSGKRRGSIGKQTRVRLVKDHISIVSQDIATGQSKVSIGNLGEARENMLP